MKGVVEVFTPRAKRGKQSQDLHRRVTCRAGELGSCAADARARHQRLRKCGITSLANKAIDFRAFSAGIPAICIHILRCVQRVCAV